MVNLACLPSFGLYCVTLVYHVGKCRILQLALVSHICVYVCMYVCMYVYLCLMITSGCNALFPFSSYLWFGLPPFCMQSFIFFISPKLVYLGLNASL